MGGRSVNEQCVYGREDSVMSVIAWGVGAIGIVLLGFAFFVGGPDMDEEMKKPQTFAGIGGIAIIVLAIFIGAGG